jgi:predicted Zn-dependent protease
MVKRLGDKISTAAQKWYESIGEPNYLSDYRWEYHLIKDEQVNAWCMPGGKIVVYTGIIPVAGNEDALAVVMGHEVAHALLNHGRQRVSVNLLTQAGLTVAALGVALSGADQDTQALFLGALGLGASLGVALPFSRDNESEADEYGLYLMAIAGYNPEASVPFWENMDRIGKSGPEFLSTHPASDTRAKNLRKLIPDAKKRAAKLRIDAIKESIPRAIKVAAEINGQ